MVTRKISYGKYIIAFIVTILVISLGFTLGIVIDTERIAWAENAQQKQETDYQSLQLQYLYLNSLNNDPAQCNVLHATLQKSIGELGESLERVSEYRESSRIHDTVYQLWQRRYVLDNFRYWFFALQAKKTCKIDIVTILYFYSEKKCTNCPDQGVILTYFKKLYDERLLVFPIDIDQEKEEPFIAMMTTRYNITQYPSIVIDDTTYPGMMPEEKLRPLICDGFINKTICKT